MQITLNMAKIWLKYIGFHRSCESN